MLDVYVALGANLNDPKAQLNSATEALMNLAVDSSFRISSYYQSKPMGDVAQPDYINAVASFTTWLSPLALLDKLQQIEAQHSRERLVRWGPRTLDLDLLLYGNLFIQIPGLTVPHYGMKDRSFVLVPLLEIEPKLCLPSGETVQSLVTLAMTEELKKM